MRDESTSVPGLLPESLLPIFLGLCIEQSGENNTRWVSLKWDNNIMGWACQQQYTPINSPGMRQIASSPRLRPRCC